VGLYQIIPEKYTEQLDCHIDGHTLISNYFS